jgi:nucleoside 2-deoxyribosyltransferase
MGKCFVIQPFDRGKYDKRFDDVLAPAIEEAGLEPYRVDRDPAVTIPIEQIASQIAASDVCLCDITTDNPNVWFELGFAIASQREVVMICADERKTAFPFDVQHRAIIRYVTESPNDFVSLKNQIRDRLVAMMEKRDALGSIGTIASVTQIEGLEQFEIAALVAVAQQIDGPDDEVSAYVVRQDMENAGFTKLAATLGLRSLLDKRLLITEELADVDGSRYTAYQPTTEGVRWLFANRDKLTLKTPPRAPADDSIPF